MDPIISPCPDQSFSDVGTVFSSLVQTILAAQCAVAQSTEWPEDDVYNILAEYDVIVVGAGSAGSVVAGRLSDIDNWNVLLLEAGGNPPLSSEIPGFPSTFAKTSMDWQYSTESSTGAKDRTCYWPRAKLLGGCSAINGMLYFRGTKKDYDNWEAQGNTGWNFENVLPYFKKHEDLQIHDLLEEDVKNHHGSGGELIINLFNDSHPFKAELLAAAKEKGYSIIDDIHGDKFTGYTTSFATVNNGLRCSSARGFVSKKKSNLHVVRFAHVTKVLINAVTKQAEGVEFINKEGNKIVVKATKEVVLSGGAVNSPQLLMLSGIGPAKDLEALGLPVIADLPVGKNLQDHIAAPLFIKISNYSMKVDTKMDSLYQYLIHREGPYAGIGTMDLLGFVNTENPTSKFPNIQLFHRYVSIQNKDHFKEFLPLEGDYTQSIVDSNSNHGTLVILPALINPKSTGEIKLRSADPLDKPLIYPNYLANEEDVELLLQAVKYVREFINTPTMKKLGAEFVKAKPSGCESYEFDSDDYWRCFIRSTATTCYHPAGSVKMGPEGDATAVVDSRLKVFGVNGLRVADTSIMPNITSGPLNAPAMMIGEKLADMIKTDWNLLK